MEIKRNYKLTHADYEDFAALCELMCIDEKKLVRAKVLDFLDDNRHRLRKKDEEPAEAPPDGQRRKWIE